MMREIIRQLDRPKKYDIKTADKQRNRLDKDGAHAVSEVYSPPRVTAMAEKLGLDAGWALVFNVADDDRMASDFSNQAKRDKALQKIRADKPFMLSTSPMCWPFSALQGFFNYPKMNHAEVKRKLSEAMLHVQFCMQLCHEQHANGRLFVFEHPAGAASWSMKAIQQMRQLGCARG